MTQIIFGRHIQHVHNAQLERARTKTLAPAVKDLAKATRSRLACYYSQYDFIPIMVKGRVIAHVPGKYLAKIVKSSKACRFIASIDAYVRRMLLEGKPGSHPFGISHKQLLVLEDSQMGKPMTTAASPQEE